MMTPLFVHTYHSWLHLFVVNVCRTSNSLSWFLRGFFVDRFKQLVKVQVSALILVDNNELCELHCWLVWRQKRMGKLSWY
ncbi:hypothetical protein QYF36_020163 [Acer negundo]|nr:hypothetical protein QYF36_020163 [Acer negundo]